MKALEAVLVPHTVQMTSHHTQVLLQQVQRLTSHLTNLPDIDAEPKPANAK